MEEKNKDYKNTLLMPKTDFSMKANLSEKEILYRKRWEEINLYKRVLEQNKNNKSFILHDGPPYANGNIHVGHALNKILKDIIVRSKNMQGFYSPFVAGWDTHGLPIEHKMLLERKMSAKDFSISELRKACGEYALSQVQKQKEQFKQLSLLTDFSEIYITLDKEFEAEQLKLFKKMVFDGLIYKDLKPIYWSPSSQSALAEAEVEYADHISPSLYVAFKVNIGNNLVSKNDFILIWTTTPWTLIANSGVAINKDFEYIKVKVNNNNYVVAKELLESIANACKWENYKIIGSSFKGKELLNVKYESPINKLLCPIVEGHHVTLENGTGLVHMAPLFGEDDFIIGNKNNLEKIMHVEDDGTLNEKALQFNGIFYDDANPLIGKFLEENNLLLGFKKIKHSYPHDWRTHLPIMYRATPQWFVSLKPIKDKIIQEINNVKTYNDWSKNRLLLMLENRDTWCISRQRSWGVPIIAFYDKNKKPVLKEEIFDYVIDLVKKHGSNIWYEKTVDELLPEKYRGLGFYKENDIMDVWFDSGSTSLGVKPSNIEAPFDLYLEGSDQYRGWFNSSMINSVAWRNKSPFKAFISHGFTLDGKGRKMSKSLGNTVDPLEVSKKYGSDILRLWAANSEYTADITIDNKILDQNVEIYRKLRNTIKFMLGGISDFDFKEIKIDGIHALMLEKLNNLEAKAIHYYDNYRFVNVVKEVNNFIIDLSSYYISITKDILYLDRENDLERRQVQTVFAKVLESLMQILAPILPTTMEEVYEFYNVPSKMPSVHLLKWNLATKQKTDLEKQWEEFFILKDEVYRLIEENIKNQVMKRQNEAFVTIKTDSKFIKSLPLTKLLMVAKVEFGKETKVSKLESKKCLRCWNHFEQKDFNEKLEICKRCEGVINGR
ncbi:isoleucine--tRNA ligase [Metamycoplasma phocicerebrale]|uniref:Isoleucine--tRNA ligase n=1 Tax=Metamycoplasma phocicerebrale TaxID=142649 RepID=A0A3Q9VBI9_9BACT|nr:isoleucine--tRNA ligase [Metamycoplasma phocicerebrale]AZZ65396.1 isoleucine--tRNA ligase [Metamycoplasma phocicerebrale]